jgi:uncharacterized protein YxjI
LARGTVARYSVGPAISIMIPALSNYLIKEHVGVFKMTGTYDIFDPATGQQIAVAQEKKGFLNILGGFLINKRMLPTRVDVHEGTDTTGPIAFSITRGFSFLRPTVHIVGGDGSIIGSLKSRLLTIGGKFAVFDASGTELAQVKGNWLSWDFKFIAQNGTEVGVISRKWGGIGREFFTSADNYVVALYEPNPAAAVLLLAAGLAVDTVYKEDKGGGGLTFGE